MKEKKLYKVWAYENEQTTAHTKSEARAFFKRRRGIRRLPKGASVVLVKDPNKV